MTLTMTLQSLLAEAKPSQTKCTIIKVVKYIYVVKGCNKIYICIHRARYYQCEIFKIATFICKTQQRSPRRILPYGGQ